MAVLLESRGLGLSSATLLWAEAESATCQLLLQVSFLFTAEVKSRAKRQGEVCASG